MLTSLPMKTQNVIAALGSNAEVARVLGITHAAVSQWGDEPPLLQQYRLAQLRPDLFEMPAPARGTPEGDERSKQIAA